MVFQIPSEFKDENKWFKFFTTTSLLVFIATAMITYFLAIVSVGIFSTMIPGIVVGLIIIAAAMILVTQKIPEESYLTGAGQTLAIILIRLYIRKKKQVIYIKGYNRKGDDF